LSLASSRAASAAAAAPAPLDPSRDRLPPPAITTASRERTLLSNSAFSLESEKKDKKTVNKMIQLQKLLLEAWSTSERRRKIQKLHKIITQTQTQMQTQQSMPLTAGPVRGLCLDPQKWFPCSPPPTSLSSPTVNVMKEKWYWKVKKKWTQDCIWDWLASDGISMQHAHSRKHKQH